MITSDRKSGVLSRVDRVQTVNSNQTSVRINVYQGESRMVKDNLRIGQFEVNGIPSGAAGQEVDVRFTYDLNGVFGGGGDYRKDRNEGGSRDHRTCR